MDAHSILLVDDEPRILHSLTRELREADINEIITASNGLEGLQILKNPNNISVVVSDYRMPGMDGINFLTEVYKVNPDIIRIILTGVADLNMAIEAVNRGRLFRLLTKPCADEIFIDVVKSGFEQYRLITSERELLSKTLSGSVKILVDILSVLNPEEFSRSTRLRDAAKKLAVALDKQDRLWEVELSALLCQIGSVAVPKEVLEKWKNGIELTEVEEGIIHSIPRIGKQLVQNIPRLENIAEGIAHQFDNYNELQIRPDALSGKNIPFLGRILKIIVDFDIFLGRTGKEISSIEEMVAHKNHYDPEMFQVFQDSIIKAGVFISPKSVTKYSEKKLMNIENLKVGMEVVKDLFDRRGRLVVSKGTVITEALRYRLINFFWNEEIIEPVTIDSAGVSGN